MTDQELVTFLKWCLPEMELRWTGFRKVRRTLRKRLNRRIRDLGLADLAGYREKLENDPAEWPVLDEICRIPISRFYRDKHVFDVVMSRVLPDCAAEARICSRPRIRILSAGCASGEEPFSLSLIWHGRVAEEFSQCTLDILATDIDDHMLERAAAGCYSPGALKDLPADLTAVGFCITDESCCLSSQFRTGVRFEKLDLRLSVPEGPFDIIFCRNSVFTYFSIEKQAEVLSGLNAILRPGGYLILGAHESLPEAAGFHRLEPGLSIFQKSLNRELRPITGPDP